MGDLAIDLAIYYQLGTSRGDYSLLSSMDVKKAEFFGVFGETINDLIMHHHVDLAKKRWRHAAGPKTPDDHFATEFKVKGRWVDGTPEYSFYICGLRKLLALGASTIMRHLKTHPERATQWQRGILARRPVKVAVLAQAAKNARVAWAMLQSGACYQTPEGAAVGQAPAIATAKAVAAAAN